MASSGSSGTNELLLIGALGAGAYLLYSWYTGTGLFAPAAAAATTAATTAAVPVASTPVLPATTQTVSASGPAVTPAGFGPGLVQQTPWAMRPNSFANQAPSVWSSSATYGAGNVVLYAAPSGPTIRYVNLTSQNTTVSPAVDTTNWLAIAMTNQPANTTGGPLQPGNAPGITFPATGAAS